MAGLVSGDQYGLTCSHGSAHSCPDKTALLLKLTDSSLKTIERYQKSKAHFRKTPTIVFKGKKGIITFPVRESGDSSGDGFQDFKFTVQPLPMPSGSSYECIQQFRNSKGVAHLDSISQIQTKVHISATDEVYQTTQEKMKLADEEMKKISTKEISQKEVKASRKIKKITKRSGQPLHRVPGHHQANHSRPSSASASASSASASASSASTNTSASAISRSNGAPAPAHRIAHVAAKGAPTSKPAAPNKSYRDRVIHLLALRPYKKPELILRLQKDRVVMKDKNQLSNVLSQVATLSRENAYTLNKHFYSEVQEDWPLYSNEDRKLLKKNLRSINHKEHSSSVNSIPPVPPPFASLSKSSSRPSPNVATVKPIARAPSIDVAPVRPESRPRSESRPRPNPGPGRPDHQPPARSDPVRQAADKFKATITNKRPLLPDVVDFKPPKKTRIAHNTKKLSPTSEAASASCSPPSKSDVSSTTRQSPDYPSQGQLHAPVKPAPEKAETKCRTARTEAKVRPSVGKHSPSSDVSSTSNGPDYFNKFTSITSQEQKQRYKDIFNKEYAEYKKLHAYVDGFKLKFTKLREEFHQSSQDSVEQQQIKNKVLQEYAKLQEDPEYQRKDSRWRELHDKLGHIKTLIATYDNNRQQQATAT